jgi:SAM-dependent methyltransferase
MFSGSLDWGDTTDIRKETGADIVAPYDDLPIPDNSYDLVIADPPYNMGFASRWTEHDKDLPKPKHILLEAARVAKPGGLIAILHVIVVPAYKVANVERIGLHGILAGPNNAIRVLNVFRKKTTGVGN